MSDYMRLVRENDQLRAKLAELERPAGNEPVAWGEWNTAITGKRHALMMVSCDPDSKYRVPLYSRAQEAPAEAVRQVLPDCMINGNEPCKGLKAGQAAAIPEGMAQDAARWQLFSESAPGEEESCDLMATCAGIAYSFQVPLDLIDKCKTPEELLDAAIAQQGEKPNDHTTTRCRWMDCP